MWKIGSAVLLKTEILPIQPSLWLHLQLYIQITVWTKRKNPQTIWPILLESTISVKNVLKSIPLEIPPWNIKKPQVTLQLNKLPYTKTHPSAHLENFHTILLHHPDYQYIFTDGSKDRNKTAYVAVLKKRSQESSSYEKLQKYMPLTLLSTSFLGTNNKFIIHWLALCINITEK